MSVIDDPENPQLFIRSMWRHVLDPVRTAITITTAEQTELSAEQTAFENFIRRIRQIEPVPLTVKQRGNAEEMQRQATTARAAYRETMLAVDHYEREYGEPLLTNAAAELGADAAVVLDSDSNVLFTPPVKQLLVTSATQCFEDRKSVRGNIDAELESLESARQELYAVVKNLDGTSVPPWHHEQFDATLEDILQRRQQHLHTRSGCSDSHNLCAYLYEAQPWRYPVLTSLARLNNVTSYTR